MLKEALKSKFLTLIYFGVVFIFLFVGGMLLSGGFLKLNNALADSISHNLSGFAWSENYGWLSFSCENENPPCSGTNYGIDIDPNTGYFSGYAWSSNVGWVQFNASGPYPGDPQISVNYNKTTGAVTGWAKILSLGDNGWLKMYNVTIDSDGVLHGWAWNNSPSGGLGWLSFNGADSGAGGNYSVVYAKPSPDAPIIGTIEDVSCGVVKVNWTDNSNNEIGFTVQVNDGTWKDYCGLSYPTSDPRSLEIGVSRSCSGSISLTANTPYDFRVKALGDSGADSEWSPNDLGESFTTGICAPSDLTILSQSCAGVGLEWQQTGAGIDHYEVWRSDNGADYAVLSDAQDLQNTNYTDTNLLPGVKYQYKVIAVDGEGNGSASGETGIITPCPNIPKWREVKPK
jgi:hypothetical protein